MFLLPLVIVAGEVGGGVENEVIPEPFPTCPYLFQGICQRVEGKKTSSLTP